MTCSHRLPVLPHATSLGTRLIACLLIAGCGASNVLDAAGTPLSTVAGPSRIDTLTHASLIAGNARKLRVYLPPGYDSTTTRRYPVVYFQPGQNGFVNSRSASSSAIPWGLDTTLTKLIHAGTLPPMIVVAVDQFAAGNAVEYTPPASYCYYPGGASSPVPAPASTGDKYAAMVATEIKPKIDGLYRTQTAASATYLMASSTAAKEIFYMLMTYSNVFGNAAFFSLVACEGGSAHWNRVSALPAKIPVRVYIAVGGLEPSGVIANAQSAHDVFIAKGWTDGIDIAPVNIQANGAHNEVSWAKLVPAALTFLSR